MRLTDGARGNGGRERGRAEGREWDGGLILSFDRGGVAAGELAGRVKFVDLVWGRTRVE